MRILFTHGNNPVSWLICKVTGEPVSHCAIEEANCVIQSNFLGLGALSLEEFEKKSSILYSVEIPEDCTKLLRLFVTDQKAKYDFGAMLYLGLRCLFPWLPKANLWQTTGMYMCTEWVTEYINDSEDSMITPYKLYLRLSKGEK